jgi:uncharacterized SAM-binding protein YcdF (DUF218 family)
MRHTQHYAALDLSRPTGAQAIVILGGGIRRQAPEYGGDAPNDGSLQRITYGARVARATGLPVLVSGGVVRGGTPESVVMKEFLEHDLSVPVRWTETESQDTAQNASRSAAMLEAAGIHRIILVTTGLHMSRSVNEFRATGLEVIAAPVHLWSPFDTGVLAAIPNMDALVRSNLALYELGGELVRRIRVMFGG